MFINCLVDYLVECAIQESEHRMWESIVEPHPDFSHFERPDYNQFMGSRLNWKLKPIDIVPIRSYKRKRDDEYNVTLKIRAPKSTKLNQVQLCGEYAHFNSGQNYPGSPYYYSKSILCQGRQCYGCLQNNCN